MYLLSNLSLSNSYNIFVEKLIKIGGEVDFDVSLSTLSRWRIGGVARCIVKPTNLSQIQQIVVLANEFSLKYLVIGETTNLLFSDEGLDVLVIRIGKQFSQCRIDNNLILAQAGVWVPYLARVASVNGLTGIEHVSGIPGTLGGLVCMNGGSQRKGIGEHITEVTTISSDGTLNRYSKKQCDFKYRDSIFHTLDDIIIEVVMELKKGGREKIRNEMLGILKSRRLKFPQKIPNCGSVFVSNPAMYKEFGPPGAVIEKCGLKGVTRGGAQVSEEHANFIVNNCEASANDVLYLIDHIRDVVSKETGYFMQAEARYVSPCGQFIPAHKVNKI